MSLHGWDNLHPFPAGPWPWCLRGADFVIWGTYSRAGEGGDTQVMPSLLWKEDKNGDKVENFKKIFFLYPFPAWQNHLWEPG